MQKDGKRVSTMGLVAVQQGRPLPARWKRLQAVVRYQDYHRHPCLRHDDDVNWVGMQAIPKGSASLALAEHSVYVQDWPFGVD